MSDTAVTYYDSLIAPVYALGSTSVGPTVLTESVIDAMQPDVRFPLKIQHEYGGHTAGWVDNVRLGDDGYYADVHVNKAYNNHVVDSSGVRGLSIGIYVDALYKTADRLTTVVTHGTLREVSLVRRAAFSAAKLSNKKG